MKRIMLWTVIVCVVVGSGIAMHAIRKHHHEVQVADAIAAHKEAAAAARASQPPSYTNNTLNAQPERINEVAGGMRATMLNIAAYKGQAEVVKELLRRGAKVNVQTKE